MCSSGTVSALSTVAATLCMVFVHSSTRSAPAASSVFASAASTSPAPAQSPAIWSRSITEKSTDSSRQRAECRPPSRSRTISLSSW
jgi:hypothetical protein